MTQRLKLKRGLSDISPLFSKETEDFRPRAQILAPAKTLSGSGGPVTPEICFVWSADDEGDAHFLNNFFASKMVANDSSALLMTFEDGDGIASKAVRSEPWGQSLQRICLPAASLEKAFREPSQWSYQQGSEKTKVQIFLEISMKSLLSCPDLIRSLDHVILFLKPNVDSVTETYRKLKRLAAFELKAEVTVLFDADDAGGLPSRLYELFSDFVSRRLSLSMNFLGTLHLSRGGEGLRQDICWESWTAVRNLRPECIEKMHFLSWIEKLKKEEVRK